MATKLFLLLILLSHAASSLSEGCRPEDKRALFQIKKELNNPTILSPWKPHTDCCKLSWFGVNCFRSNNRVGYLSISNDTNLTSPFPASIGNLPYLESLLLSLLPNLTGPIPIKPISLLTNLKSLAISSTGILGPIPNFTAQLKNLIYLDLSCNNLSGTLPPSLIYLDVSHNQIYGNLPVGIENISLLNVSYNRLCGEIPNGGYMQSFDVYSFFHNKCLCGSPLPSCK